VILGLGAALFGAFSYGAASVLQAVGAARASGPAVVRQPVYLLGLVCDLIAWLASLVALQRMPAFAVQSLLAGSVGITVLLAWLFLGARPRPRDGVALVLLTAALVGVAAASGSQAASAAPRGFALAAWVSVVVLGGLLAATYRPGRWAPVSVVAGAAFAGAAVCARGMDASAGLSSLLLEPLVWAIAGFGVLGALGYARALESGQVGPATALLWVVEVLVAGGVGVFVLGDQVRPGLEWLAVLSVVVAVAASGVLALSPAAEPRAATG
jgi:hypothetical protein